MEIIQDTREPNLQMMADVDNLKITFKKEFLGVGDYHYKDIIIERKEITDFAHSIIDKRLNKQCEKMKRRTNKKLFIIIVGNIKDRKVDINVNCILGKICSLICKHNIKVIQVEDDFQFLYVLKNLCDKYGKEEV